MVVTTTLGILCITMVNVTMVNHSWYTVRQKLLSALVISPYSHDLRTVYENNGSSGT